MLVNMIYRAVQYVYMTVVLIKGVFSGVYEASRDLTLNSVCKEVHGYSERESSSVVRLLMIAK